MEAARAYDKAILKLGGAGPKSASRLNFPLTDYDLQEIAAMNFPQVSGRSLCMRQLLPVACCVSNQSAYPGAQGWGPDLVCIRDLMSRQTRIPVCALTLLVLLLLQSNPNKRPPAKRARKHTPAADSDDGSDDE